MPRKIFFGGLVKFKKKERKKEKKELKKRS
jgi:hypothetical protein